jgi:hypothetical protein
MSALRVSILGVGLLGPGLPSWAAARPQLAGQQAYAAAATTVPPPPRLPPAERRRAGTSIKLAMAVADEAVAASGLDPQTLATVFAASGGEGVNCHALCETLAGADRHLSPTRFTNSVHNAAAGYWHIAVKSRAASTSLSAYDASFCAGLIEAATQVACGGEPVLLVACDVPYPEPLHRLRPLPDAAGVALLLAPSGRGPSMAELELELLAAAGAAPPTACAGAALEGLRTGIPALAALPLLEALARRRPTAEVVLDEPPALSLLARVGRGSGPT